jgi:peptide methionine sulfoxide reductase msrA/msrB
MKSIIFAITVLVVAFLAWYPARSMEDKMPDRTTDMSSKNKTAVFAGGCFWCTESDFEKIDGVIEAVSGYTGGKVADPAYKEVARGGTGHVEAVKVVYYPARITYEDLLDVFWRHVDPTDAGGQFVDRGAQYRSAIFYHDEDERHLAETTRGNLNKSGQFEKPVVTDILPLGPFYPAEEYHQDYYKKNPIRYKYYRSGSGRDSFLKNAWKDIQYRPKTMPEKTMGMKTDRKNMESMKTYEVPDNDQLKQRLTVI